MELRSIKQRYDIIGRSEALDRALSTAVRVAPTDLTVLITGESGVGKEVFSLIIHSLSPRKHNKFIAVNGGAIPEGTINSELFGHDKGAFTGATSDRQGYFETVDGGTIFLDEVGEIPLDTQAYLLRVLETGEFIRVGSSKVQKTDVRVIAATNVDLLEKVRQGKFREDLYYRLNIVPIKVPSLKERKEDIPILFRKFAVDFAEKYRTDSIQLDDEARQLIVNYPWPGNVRELKNVVEQLSVLSDRKLITADELRAAIPDIRTRHLPAIANAPGDPATGSERDILYKVLFDMRGDLTDLKQLVFELIKTNDLSMPNIARAAELQLPAQEVPGFDPEPSWQRPQVSPDTGAHIPTDSQQPILISPDKDVTYDVEEVEESLSIAAMEKALIEKVLKKHGNRRKDAAEELGISERTLYRKIKLYELQ